MNRQFVSQSGPNAVVLGLGINGLALVRSLGIHGVNVSGIYVDDNEFGRFSRYCNSIRFPHLKSREEEFLAKLIENFGDAKERSVLFADSDEYIMFMSRHRGQLQKYFRFLLPDHELLDILVEKDRSATYIVGKGLRIPNTWFPIKYDDIDQSLTKIDYPCLVKPINSYSVNLESKTLTFPDANSLRIFFQERPELIGGVVVQQIIPGEDSDIYQLTTYVSRHGNVAPIFTMRKIRQNPPNFGITCYGLSESTPALTEKVRDFLIAIQYRGLISIEFKKDPYSGEWFYIESNPRLPYYHMLIYDSGINYPYIYYLDMVDSESIDLPVASQKDGVRWICFSRDLASFTRKFSQRKIGLSDWLGSVVKARSFAFYSRKDPKPFLHASYFFMKKLGKTLVKGINV